MIDVSSHFWHANTHMVFHVIKTMLFFSSVVQELAGSRAELQQRSSQLATAIGVHREAEDQLQEKIRSLEQQMQQAVLEGKGDAVSAARQVCWRGQTRTEHNCSEVKSFLAGTDRGGNTHLVNTSA